ncbi:TIGR04076 family protein [Desulfitobacterium dehalogenans ATCC 51507]|uniref:TIGR04076 family protein n=1 Tax=Desulfitobacterium dehalogenans (strain ATCC 51507 / DSM 9161 / JW/IU-DC1) TaxID=756499 RepID=I4A7G3_DESDJ|nr:TIGR04076 family protein [Desulfitobacterium dehalogenans]AFL99897.1 TIGR04076 family protein [Desulfitobacterium dehalogenans ATCC 51507]
MKKVRITVIRKEFYPEFADRYLTGGKNVGPCPLMNEGDIFLYEGGAEIPKGFCPWAWIDIYRGVNALSAGATYKPWNNQDGVQILCCTDGIRPVVFLVEAVNDETE